MKVFIIGSRGFIGSHVKRFFEETHGPVWAADVVVDYDGGPKYFVIDPSNADFKTIFLNNDFDLCVNCSGAASVPDSLSNPHRDYILNAANVFSILESIRTYQPNCKFINLSSAAVYGSQTKLPIAESAIASPVSPYGMHKLMSEQICYEYFRFFNVPTCSLRIFSAFGEGLRKQLFWDLFRKTKLTEEIVLFGTGKESRDFIYIKDLVQAIGLVAERGQFVGDVINIANGEEVFIKDCVELFYALCGTNIRYKFSGESRSGDPNNWVADITKISAIGYRKRYSLQDGLSNYVEWIRGLD